MKRRELEHIIRAAGDIADDDEIVVIGSQAILGQFPEAPDELCISEEADVFPKNHPERWDLIDGSIGELSPFHDTFGYYAQGVAEDTAMLPDGWKLRLVPINNSNTRGITGYCLEVHDLAISKYLANRDKDRRFNRGLARYGLTDRATLLDRLSTTQTDPRLTAVARRAIETDFASAPQQ